MGAQLTTVAGTEAGEDAVRFAHSAERELAALVHAVDAVVGHVEFAVLLFGPPASRTVEHLELIEAQRVTIGSFEVDVAGLERTMVLARRKWPTLVVRGIAHRHPGLGLIAAQSSNVDEEFIEWRLLDTLSAAGLSWSEWERDLVPNEHGLCALDETERMALLVTSDGPARLRLRVRERVAETLSLVFDQRAEAMTCVARRVRFVPIPTASGVTLARITERSEPAIVREAEQLDAEGEAYPCLDDLEQKVRARINRRGPYNGTDA